MMIVISIGVAVAVMYFGKSLFYADITTPAPAAPLIAGEAQSVIGDTPSFDPLAPEPPAGVSARRRAQRPQRAVETAIETTSVPQPTRAQAAPPNDDGLDTWRRRHIRTAEAEPAIPANTREYWEDDPGWWKYVTRRVKLLPAAASRIMPRAPGVSDGQNGKDTSAGTFYR